MDDSPQQKHPVGLHRIKRLFVGRPFATTEEDHHLLPKRLALPLFASDPLSSVAYATEEIMLVLVLAGAGTLTRMIPIAVAIAILVIVVVSAYRQTVRAYPQGGGAYLVTRDNLGHVPARVAASALMIDYILTVAVSVTLVPSSMVFIGGGSGVPASSRSNVVVVLGAITLSGSSSSPLVDGS